MEYQRDLSPAHFEPVTKTMLWGTERWVLSGIEGSSGPELEGFHAFRTLPELVAMYGPELLGHRIYEQYGGRFPLLVKDIATHDRLSIQVHPDDAMAAREHGKLGKTEMWYVREAAAGSTLIDGFARPLRPEQYDAAVADGSIEGYLNSVAASPGEVYHLPAGRVHGLGAGLRICEIQQSSDVTYRLYDYHRRDAEGRERELHTALARQAIDFAVTPEPQTAYEMPEHDTMRTIIECPAFSTSICQLRERHCIEWREWDEFHLITAVKNSVAIAWGFENGFILDEGECALIPASQSRFEIGPLTDLLTYRELPATLLITRVGGLGTAADFDASL